MPNWRIQQSRRRLAVSLVISAAVVGGALSLLRFSVESLYPSEVPAIVEISVVQQQTFDEQLEAIEPIEEIEEDPPIEAVAEEVTEIDPEPDSTATAREDAGPPEVTTDWYQLLETVASASDSFTDESPSLSAEFDELRRVAALTFSKPDTRFKKPIWENVEKDTMGRTILRAGDCYRVLEDPRVTQIWFQENFGQYLVLCETTGKPPVELAFVQNIQERYNYLKPDSVNYWRL